MAIAAARGAQTGGRSELYQAALIGFGLHAVGHVGMSVATGGYTPGVVTAPLVVAPFSLWAWHELAAAGVPRGAGSTALWGLAAIPVTIGAGHLLARAFTRSTAAGRPGAPPTVSG